MEALMYIPVAKGEERPCIRDNQHTISRPLTGRERSVEFFSEFFLGEIDYRDLIFRHQVEEHMTVYAEYFRSFPLQEVMFSKQFHDQDLFGFRGAILLVEVCQYLIRQIKFKIQSPLHSNSSMFIWQASLQHSSPVEAIQEKSSSGRFVL
jgi:hypothetical protein